MLLMKTSGCEIIGDGTGGATTTGCFFRIGEKKCLSLDSFFTVRSLVTAGATVAATGVQLSLGLLITSLAPFICGMIIDAVMFPC